MPGGRGAAKTLRCCPLSAKPYLLSGTGMAKSGLLQRYCPAGIRAAFFSGAPCQTTRPYETLGRSWWDAS